MSTLNEYKKWSKQIYNNMIDDKMIVNKLRSVSDDIVENLIKETLKVPGPPNVGYPTRGPKSPTDALECVVCGGRYIRKFRYIHFKTKKHNKAIQIIKDKLKAKIDEMDNE